MPTPIETRPPAGRPTPALRPPARARLAARAALLAALLAAAPAAAHDVPGEMRVHAFVRSDGDRLHVLVRLPLALLLNLDLPKRGPGFVDLAHVEPVLARAVAATDRELELFEDGRRLSLAAFRARISTPSDRSFESLERADALLRGPPLPEATDVFWNQGYFDAALEYPLRSPGATISIDFHVLPGRGDALKLDLRHVSPSGTIRAYELATGSGEVVLDPRWHHAARSFVRSGFGHILDGLDHLLFLLCLVLPFRRMGWRLVGMITAFTLAHSVTLVAAAYGLVPSGPWFPPLVETLIAASILYTAIENVVRPEVGRRWILSGAFGLVHGFGFSFLLASKLQLAGSHLLLSLVSFNVGIELGQLLVLAVAMPLLVLLRRLVGGSERLLTAVLSFFAAHSAWHWATERAGALAREEWPPLEAATIAGVAALAALGGGVAWLVLRAPRRRADTPAGADVRPALGGR